MSLNYSSNRLETAYVQLQGQGNLLTVPNTSGTWTATGNAAMRFTTITMKPTNPVNDVNYKTGSSSQPVGVRGRAQSTFDIEKPFIPSGAAGTKPDDDPLLQHIFGPATVVASTSVTYALSDVVNPFSIMWYDKSALTTPINQYSFGNCAQSVSVAFGGPFPTLKISGIGVFAPNSSAFSSYTGVDAVAKGALTTYPAEPGSPTFTGNVIPGFGMTVSIDGNTFTEVRGTPTISINTGIEFATDGVSNAYPFAAIRGLRTISLTGLQLANSDDTNLVDLRQKAFNKSPISVSLSLLSQGAGNIVTFNLNNVQLDQDAFQENGTFLDVVFSTNPAHASTPGAINDATLVLT